MRRLLVVLVLLASACASVDGESALGPTIPPSDDSGPPVVFVSVGGAETLGANLDDQLRQSWPQLLLGDGLPRRAVHVNLATPDATAGEALDRQVPAALEVGPTLATVWLADGDAQDGTSVAAYRRELDQVVRRLGEGGARVLVVVGPSPEGDLALDAYNDAAAEVASAAGVELADLTGAVSGLDAAGHRQVAMMLAELVAAGPP